MYVGNIVFVNRINNFVAAGSSLNYTKNNNLDQLITFQKYTTFLEIYCYIAIKVQPSTSISPYNHGIELQHNN